MVSLNHRRLRKLAASVMISGAATIYLWISHSESNFGDMLYLMSLVGGGFKNIGAPLLCVAYFPYHIPCHQSVRLTF